MIVLKFGGTSVQDAPHIDNVLDITCGQIDKSPVLISSAMGKTTDRIIEAYTQAVQGNRDNANTAVQQISDLHRETAKAFLSGENKEKALATVETYLKDFSSLIKGIYMLRECSPRTKDTMLSFGERLSTLLIYHRAVERGISAELLDSRDFIKTDDQYTAAIPDFKKTNTLVREIVKPIAGKITIAQGFISSQSAGITTTLGRGGSDYTASIIGAALGAEEVQIWTDVNGIMTTDPRIISSARSISEMTYNEAGELAYFGAKVVHPATIQPAVYKSIPVYVKNSHQPEQTGTAIISKTKDTGLKAIAVKNNITLINITSSRMLNAYGFLKKIFTFFDDYKIPVDLISTSEVSVSVTVDGDSHIDELITDLESLGAVTVEKSKAIICLVGQQLWKNSQFNSRVFKTMADIPIRMISLGSSDINLSLVVPEEKSKSAVQMLHKEFFPE